MLALLLAQGAYSQEGEPQRTLEADVPFEMIAPWYKNPKKRTELLDEVVMRGTLKVTARIWQTRLDHIDRFSFHANAVDISGTSETTGQRYRVTGTFSYDLRDPDVTFNPDGTFTVPDQPFKLKMLMVDPEPARLTDDLFGTTGATAAAVFYDPVPPTPCQRLLTPDGNPTTTVHCGNITVNYVGVATPFLYRIVSSGGSACVSGEVCVVPDGATLFNGYTGGYNRPLFMQVKVQTQSTQWRGVPVARSVRMFCQTGNREPIITGSMFAGGMFVSSCRPIYSGTEPIRIWAEIAYRYYRYPNGSSSSPQEVNLLVNEKPFTFHMDERAIDQSPVISNLIVSGVSRINDRCPIGTSCELIDNDILFNGREGDYDMPLSLHVSATDPEGDPILVEWVCLSLFQTVPVTNQGSPNASCSPAYTYPTAVQIYARVSDGANYVWTPFRYLYFLERVN
jgi:hypothetical protein